MLAQQARDSKVHWQGLVNEMGKTYSFTVSMDELKNYPVLQESPRYHCTKVGANNQMWVFQNIHDPPLEVCCLLARWRSHDWWQLDRAIVNSFMNDVDSRITKFYTVFAEGFWFKSVGTCGIGRVRNGVFRRRDQCISTVVQPFDFVLWFPSRMQVGIKIRGYRQIQSHSLS